MISKGGHVLYLENLVFQSSEYLKEAGLLCYNDFILIYYFEGCWFYQKNYITKKILTWIPSSAFVKDLGLILLLPLTLFLSQLWILSLKLS